MPRIIPATGLTRDPIAPAVSNSTSVATAVAVVLPPSCLLPGPRRVLDQREVPCCTSCAIAAAAESANVSWTTLSPLFHYFVARVDVAHGSPSQMSNLTLEDAMRAIAEVGICLEAFHGVTMDAPGVCVRPSDDARRDALARRLPPVSVFPPIPRIEPIGNGNRTLDWKRALLTGKPIVAGIDLPDGYDRTMTRASTTGGRLGASHAVAILGYRDSEQAFVVHDSRGPDWFLGGQWWMPYSFAESGFVDRAFSLNFQ
jgi:hypothetical protein